MDELSRINISEGIPVIRALQLIDRLVGEGHLSPREGELIKPLLTDKALIAPGVNKDTLRASLIKNLALHLSKGEA